MSPAARRPSGVAILHAPATQRLRGVALLHFVSEVELAAKLWRPAVDVKRWCAWPKLPPVTLVPRSPPSGWAFSITCAERSPSLHPSRSVARCDKASFAHGSWQHEPLREISSGVCEPTGCFLWSFVFHWGAYCAAFLRQHRSPVFTELNGVFAIVPKRLTAGTSCKLEPR